jgi:hypothetical protein
VIEIEIATVTGTEAGTGTATEIGIAIGIGIGTGTGIAIPEAIGRETSRAIAGEASRAPAVRGPETTATETETAIEIAIGTEIEAGTGTETATDEVVVTGPAVGRGAAGDGVAAEHEEKLVVDGRPPGTCPCSPFLRRHIKVNNLSFIGQDLLLHFTLGVGRFLEAEEGELTDECNSDTPVYETTWRKCRIGRGYDGQQQEVWGGVWCI